MTALNQDKKYKDKLPWQQVLSLSSANFSQAVMLTTPFTIGVFMVRDFQAAQHGGREEAVNEQVVGRLTGLLAGIFSFSSFLTAYAWGCASNYIGRKPVIVIGNAVSFVSILWFGLSGDYGTALAARAFGGFLNGILGAWKCMIGESTDVLLQGKFFGYMSLAWGLGCIAGPALGGAFSRPCSRLLQLPGCGEGGLLRTRPYFLACLVGSVTILAALLLSVFLLEETLPEDMRTQGLASAMRRRRQRERRRLLGQRRGPPQSQSDGDPGPGGTHPSDDRRESDADFELEPDLVPRGGKQQKKAQGRWRRRERELEGAGGGTRDGDVDGGGEQGGWRRWRGQQRRSESAAEAGGGGGDGSGGGDAGLASAGAAAVAAAASERVQLLNGCSERSDAAAVTPASSAHQQTRRGGHFRLLPPWHSAQAGGSDLPPDTAASETSLITNSDFSDGLAIAGPRDGAGSDDCRVGRGRADAVTRTRTPSLARLQGLLRLASRTYIGENPFARAASSRRRPAGGGSAEEDDNGSSSSPPSPLPRLAAAGAIAVGKGSSARNSGVLGDGGGCRELGWRKDTDGGSLIGTDAGRHGHGQGAMRSEPRRSAELLLPGSSGTHDGGGSGGRGGGRGCADSGDSFGKVGHGRQDGDMEGVVAAGSAGAGPSGAVDGAATAADEGMSDNPVRSELQLATWRRASGPGREDGRDARVRPCGCSESCRVGSGASCIASAFAPVVAASARRNGVVGAPAPPPGRKGLRSPPPEPTPHGSASECSSSSDSDSDGERGCYSHGDCGGTGSRNSWRCRRGDREPSLGPLPEEYSIHRGSAMFLAPGSDDTGSGGGGRGGKGIGGGEGCEDSGRGLQQGLLKPPGTAAPEGKAEASDGGQLRCRRSFEGIGGAQQLGEIERQQTQLKQNQLGEEGEEVVVVKAEREEPRRPLPWFRYPQVVLTILGYGATALIFCAVDEVFPIFASAPRASGGLGMREEQIAPPLMFFGAVLMPYSLYGYPPLQRRVGTLRLTRWGLAASVATCLMIPLVADFWALSAVFAQIFLYGAMVIKAFAQCSAFTGSIIAVNAAPAPEQLGAVNGVGQTLAALVRGVGPALGGLLWAASLGLHSAGQQFLTFGMIAAVAAANFGLYGFVRLPNMK